MTRNPYAPPKSYVKDLRPERLLADRPTEVIRAVRLLWISLIIGAPMLYFDRQRSTDISGPVFWVVTVVIVALAAVINVYVWRGANWARILVLVLCILSAVSVAAIIDQFLAYSIVEIGLTLVDFGIEALAIYWLFRRPGALWFRRAATR